MKKLLTLAIAAASFMPAAVILCTPSNQNVITNATNVSPQVANCGAVVATPGFNITAVALQIVGSFQDTIGGTNHNIEFTATHSASAPVLVAATGINDFVASTGAVVGSSAAIAPTGNLAASTISVSAASLGGLVLPDNASFSAFLVTTETSLVPEPSTMALLGSALVGLGLVARRRKQ